MNINLYMHHRDDSAAGWKYETSIERDKDGDFRLEFVETKKGGWSTVSVTIRPDHAQSLRDTLARLLPEPELLAPSIPLVESKDETIA